jgi:hypothetical protein
MSDDEIRELIDQDIERARKAGHRVNMMGYGLQLYNVGVYEPRAAGCSVCAIGAVLLGKPVTESLKYQEFAKLVGRSDTWAGGFVDGTMGEEITGTENEEFRAGYELGLEMRYKYHGLEAL